MPNFETHVIVGHVGSLTDLKYTSDGVAVVTLSVAVNDPRRKDDPPTWWRCSVWRQTAEFVAQYVTKGAAVLVAGDRVKLSEWTGQNGEARTSLELNATSVQLLGARGDDAGQPARESGGRDADVPF